MRTRSRVLARVLIGIEEEKCINPRRHVVDIISNVVLHYNAVAP